MNARRCIVVTKSITQEDAVRKRLDVLEVVKGSNIPNGPMIQKTTYFRTTLTADDEQFLKTQQITYFGDEDTTVGLV